MLSKRNQRSILMSHDVQTHFTEMISNDFSMPGHLLFSMVSVCSELLAFMISKRVSLSSNKKQLSTEPGRRSHFLEVHLFEHSFEYSSKIPPRFFPSSSKTQESLTNSPGYRMVSHTDLSGIERISS